MSIFVTEPVRSEELYSIKPYGPDQVGIGRPAEQRRWQGLRDMPKGMPRPGDEGLDHTDPARLDESGPGAALRAAITKARLDSSERG